MEEKSKLQKIRRFCLYFRVRIFSRASALWPVAFSSVYISVYHLLYYKVILMPNWISFLRTYLLLSEEFNYTLEYQVLCFVECTLQVCQL